MVEITVDIMEMVMVVEVVELVWMKVREVEDSGGVYEGEDGHIGDGSGKGGRDGAGG